MANLGGCPTLSHSVWDLGSKQGYRKAKKEFFWKWINALITKLSFKSLTQLQFVLTYTSTAHLQVFYRCNTWKIWPLYLEKTLESLEESDVCIGFSCRFCLTTDWVQPLVMLIVKSEGRLDKLARRFSFHFSFMYLGLAARRPKANCTTFEFSNFS